MNLILGAFFVIRPYCASIAKLAKVQRTKTDYRRRDERLGERAAAHNTDRGKTMHARCLVGSTDQTSKSGFYFSIA